VLLSTQVCKWVTTNLVLGVILGWINIPSGWGAGGVEILLVASCYKIGNKLRPEGSLGLYADFTLFIFWFVYCIKTTLYLANSLSEALDKTAVDGASSDTTEELFDCVICGQTSTSTEGRPIGLVALLQPSAGKTFFLKNLLKTKGTTHTSKLFEYSAYKCYEWRVGRTIICRYQYEMSLPRAL